MIIANIGELATPQGTAARRGEAVNELKIIENAAVKIKDERIEKAGPEEEIIPGKDSCTCRIIDARGKAVVPGFVDPHTHFIFAGSRADEFSWRLQGVSYQEIMARGGGIVNTVDDTRQASARKLYSLGRKRLDNMLDLGITTVEGKSGYGLDKETEIRQLEVMKALNRDHPVDVASTFMGAHALPAEYENSSDEFIDFMIEEVLPEVADKNLAEFCDVFCEEKAFSVEESRKMLEAAEKAGLAPKIHADEITPLGGAELAAEVGAVSAEHLLKISPAGIEALSAEDVVAVLLPLTAFSLQEEYAPGRKMIDQNVPVALATDFNPGSCYTQSLPLLIAAACLYMDFTPAEALTAVTLNAAAALNRAEEIGSLEAGKQADMLILDAPSYRHLPYQIGTNLVETVIKKGELI
ncbi:imidazolonepropionase [Halarsenatibacter silvermanii]|nr:imidazolonepropionase [Halarsenatibacter silvermanii]